MMKNGLLHTPPKLISDSYNKLFEAIEMCIQPSDNSDRFKISDKIIIMLETILKINTQYL